MRGESTRNRLYETALRLIAERGYERTTLRAIAKEASVSPGLLYSYFPNKQAVVLALYDELSAQYASLVEASPAGGWFDRSLFALRTSLQTIAAHRSALSALIPSLISPGEQGLFAEGTAFSRLRVQRAFERAVVEADDAPDARTAEALGRLFYVLHLAILLWWLLDRSPNQRATTDLLQLLETGGRPAAALILSLPFVHPLLHGLDQRVREGLFGEALPTS